jgi:hypothetical protein
MRSLAISLKDGWKKLMLSRKSVWILSRMENSISGRGEIVKHQKRFEFQTILMLSIPYGTARIGSMGVAVIAPRYGDE